MGRVLTVAAAQTGPVAEDAGEAMRQRGEELIEQAADAGASIVTFSELFMAPFFPNALRDDFDRFFMSSTDPSLRSLMAAARRRRISAIIPFAEKANGGYFNSALVCDGSGEVVGIYRKTHIPAYLPDDKPGGTGSFEKLYFAPGYELPVFTIGQLRFGIQICNDRLYPEGSRVLALKGAEVIFMPICYSTYSDPAGRAAIWEVPLRARAYENGAFVVAANRVGQEGERLHLGRSMIVDPRGSVLAEGGTESEELVIQQIDLDLTVRARKLFPWWRDRRPDLYRSLAAGSDPPDGGHSA